jgi:hypothetical protein
MLGREIGWRGFPADRMETRVRSAKRLSIRQVMVLIALVAISLAVVRAVPLGYLTYPTIWIFVGILDFVIAWKLMFERQLSAFHYTAILVVVVAFGVLANLAAAGSIQPLGLLARGYQQLSAERINSLSLAGFLQVGEIWAAALLSILLAFSAGWIAAWLERRLAWDIAAFWRGAFVGLPIAGVLALIYDVAHPEPGYVHLAPRRIIIGAFVLSGGLMG